MATYLDQILSRTSISVAARKSKPNLPELERAAFSHEPRGFAAALRKTATQRPAVIAELKRASPSKGVLREDYQPVSIARSYESVGAAAISVLTDEEFFHGSLADLRHVSEAVNIPVLCKDFIVDPFQILEARAHGADAILLIVAAHPDEVLQALAAEARRLGLDILCEVHDRDELARAIELGFEVIGVNSRNLKTLQVSTSIHDDLVPSMPGNVLRVAESGIRNPADVKRLLGAGYNAFLVGESLMRDPDPAAQLALLLDQS
jgi:indole-3-glycerol phosphate synthase